MGHISDGVVELEVICRIGSFSRLFESVHKREIGLHDLLSLTLFTGLRSGMIVECFHMDGTVLDYRDRLKT